jgi:hypothetical protein
MSNKSKQSTVEKIREVLSERNIILIFSRIIRYLMVLIRVFLLRRAWSIAAVYYSFRIRKFPELRDMYDYYRTTSKTTGVSICDAVVLYETVRKLKPRNVLEFGTGASTAFMALGLKHNYADEQNLKGMLCSLESEKEYMNHQLDIYPAELREFTEFIYSPVGKKVYGGDTGFFYETVPERPYDLIWVDGPALTEDVRFSGDVIDIIHYCPDRVKILFDGRDLTAKKVISMIGNEYAHRHYPVLHMNEIEKTAGGRR